MLALQLVFMGWWAFSERRPGQSKTQVQLYAAQAGGSFIEIANELSRLAASNPSVDVVLSVAPSNGSLENLRHVAELRNAMALTFAWLPANLLRADARDDYKDVRSVAVLDLDVVQLVVANRSGISTVADLAAMADGSPRFRVYTGMTASGTRGTAETLLGAAQVPRAAVKGWGEASAKMTFEEAAHALRRDELDAAIFVTGQSASAIHQLLDSADEPPRFKLLSLDRELRERLVSEHSYRHALMPAERGSDPVDTVGRPIVLAAHADASAAVVRELARLVRDNKEALDKLIKPSQIIDGKQFAGASAAPAVLKALHVDLEPHPALEWLGLTSTVPFRGGVCLLALALEVLLAWRLTRRDGARLRVSAAAFGPAPDETSLTEAQASVMASGITASGKIIEKLLGK